MTKHVIIIGAGIAGLTAAWRLKCARDAGADLDFQVLESSGRVGGQLWTDQRDGLIADGGSDSYLTAKPSLKRLATELGIAGEICGTNEDNKGTYLVKRGKLVELPDGIMLFAPTKILPMATTRLYSWPAKFRMLGDLIKPRKKQPESGPVDESIASLVTRRLGRECLTRLAEPLVGGVNGSDVETMSTLATYPQLLEMEQEFGSLVRGFLAQRKRNEAQAKAHPHKPGAPRWTFFSSFEGGMQSITDALAEGIGRERITCKARVTALSRDEDGRYLLTVSGPEGDKHPRGDCHGEYQLSADAVISAAPAWASAEMLEGLAPQITRNLEEIPFSSCATIVLGFNEADAPFKKNWHGVLSPDIEKQPVTGISLISSKWSGRAPKGTIVLRGFVGGARDPEALDFSDQELIEITRESFIHLLRLSQAAKPTYARVFRFPRSMPQYTVGHLDRMAQLDGLLANECGLALAGAAYRGVGVPNCLESGEEAAAKVLDDLGFTSHSQDDDTHVIAASEPQSEAPDQARSGIEEEA
ncbi:MAG: protoporphyrinogen oxidase [Coriobacteriia bacterium]|nr:protoporphyrinogen oxidase [Coriobacteriia bacterium]